MIENILVGIMYGVLGLGVLIGLLVCLLLPAAMILAWLDKPDEQRPFD